MAYVNKYSTTYCDVFGRTCVAYILENNFAGSVTELDADPSAPFVIDYDSSSDFKFEPVRASKCVINLILGNGPDLDEFYTANERQYKIEHYVDGVLDWVGWMIPSGFSFRLTGGLYEATIEGTDGIETLEGRPFINEATGNNYGIEEISATYQDKFIFDNVLILAECLKKTDLGLDIWIAVDLYEATFTMPPPDSRAGCPLAETSANVRVYIGDTDREDIPYWRDAGEAYNTQEVLENQCYMWAAKVYQEEGHWVLKRVNVDADIGTGNETRYYYKFDEDAAYLGREAVAGPKDIPCLDRAEPKALIGTDHEVSTDEVYRRFRVNYKYTYARQGDTFLNLIKNGDFSESWDNVSQLSAPPSWQRFREGSKWPPKFQDYVIPPGEVGDAGNFLTALEMGTQPVSYDPGNLDPYAAIWASLRYGENISVKEGDKLTFTMFAKWQPIGAGANTFGIAIQIYVIDAVTGDKEFISNKINEDNGADFGKAAWYEDNENGRLFRILTYQDTQKFIRDGITAGADSEQWSEFRIELDPIRVTGTMVVSIHGLVNVDGNIFGGTDNFPNFPEYTIINGNREVNNWLWEPARGFFEDESGTVPRLRITGVGIGIVPNTSDRETHSRYIQNNPDPSFTLQKEPITVLHGDIYNELLISKLFIKGQDETYRGRWDVIDDSFFAKSTLALAVAKSVMALYQQPRRILEGTIQGKDLQFGMTYTFTTAIGAQKFVLQRGSFNRKFGYLEDATFTEIEGDVVVGDDGSEDGVGNFPFYVRMPDNNGVHVRCQVDGSGNQTGYLEYRTEDINPNSPTFGDVVWEQSATQNTQSCPIGIKHQFYIGSGPNPPAPSNFSPVVGETNGTEYRFTMSNVEGNRMYLAHLASVGTVSEVRTSFQDDIEDDWEYYSDINIGGTMYKVFGVSYNLAQINGLRVGFKF